jgi:hypothetical protein
MKFGSLIANIITAIIIGVPLLLMLFLMFGDYFT